ncbi:hypothetical protein F5Y04DRAFT_195841 [Hypomontagnella monticulosa]|nr:hypothetical protein F5Y04DRAFT_195841 [Hypomontagnella monticulosa]
MSNSYATLVYLVCFLPSMGASETRQSGERLPMLPCHSPCYFTLLLFAYRELPYVIRIGNLGGPYRLAYRFVYMYLSERARLYEDPRIVIGSRSCLRSSSNHTCPSVTDLWDPREWSTVVISMGLIGSTLDRLTITERAQPHEISCYMYTAFPCQHREPSLCLQMQC